VVTISLSPEPSSIKDIRELISERIRGVIREVINEDVNASIMYDVIISKLPVGIRFQRDVSRYCLLILGALVKQPRVSDPVLCISSPYFALFTYPIIAGLSPDLLITYIKVARVVSVMSMTKARTVPLVRNVLEGNVPIPSELRNVLQRYGVTWETWKNGYCLLLREFLSRFVRIASIGDVIEVKNRVAYCLAEGLPYKCLLDALPRPLAYVIYNLIYVCNDLQFLVGALLSKEGTVVSTEKLSQEEREWLQRALEVTRLFREKGPA